MTRLHGPDVNKMEHNNFDIANGEVKPNDIGYVLVVEDDKMSTLFIQRALAAYNANIICVEDGESALSLLVGGNTQFNCIILDIMLPGINGLEVLQQIKANPELQHIPVIIETALSDTESIRKGYAGGAFSYLQKPLQISLLRSIFFAAFDEFNSRSRMLESNKHANRSFAFLETGRFKCRTLDESQMLAHTLAHACPDPNRVENGLHELLINAIEHGNLGITYTEKTQPLLSESWRKEVESKQALEFYRNRNVTVDFERRPNELILTLHDEGPGFEFQRYLDFEPERATHPHGRGIALARMLCFDEMEYLYNGSSVRVRINTSSSDPET